MSYIHNKQKDESKTPLKAKKPFKWVFMGIIPATSYKSLTKDTTFSNYLLIVDSYTKITELHELENITTEEVMDKLDMFQETFGKLHAFGWWDIYRIQTDSGMHFSSKEFQGGISVRGARLASATPYHQETNGQLK